MPLYWHMPRKHIRHTIGATYPWTLDERGLYHFLRSQSIAPASIARLTVIVDQHREDAWNTLWLPDGVYDVSTVTILVSTNWIAEDVYWEAFRDARERWPYWLILTAFSLARVVHSRLRQPVVIGALPHRQREQIVRHLNRILLHEVKHYLDHMRGVPDAPDEEAWANQFEREYRRQRFIRIRDGRLHPLP